ncbi:hypothetical protein EPUS_08508 [Endocarpon pusillum Z07020]|uniref:Cyanovirin-N domain-containing protein n=1 Tax=Endocarpon pusillum (strain Z07020 / HMAS-L-300199) TaxID=1263415 RepID=U1FTI3_ENDPU|nr:uncharacterized protein EPUS_08508 [Endocarpon pusillum Z07020]ERF68072.1 hypothetical protein EPUS_08508 [Endocarpon pusillum Z07020]
MRPSLLILSLTSSLISLLPTQVLAESRSLPPLYIGTIDTCSPSRNFLNYAAWVASSQPCKAHGPNAGDSSALSLIGAYPVTNAGCGRGPVTVGGYDNVTFTGCLGPPGPYPTAVARDGVEVLTCAPVKREKKVRQCESELCERFGRKGDLTTVLRCRKRRVQGEDEEEEEEDYE